MNPYFQYLHWESAKREVFALYNLVDHVIYEVYNISYTIFSLIYLVILHVYVCFLVAAHRRAPFLLEGGRKRNLEREKSLRY